MIIVAIINGVFEQLNNFLAVENQDVADFCLF